MGSRNLSNLSLGISILPLTLFIIRHLKIGMTHLGCKLFWLFMDY